MTKLEINQLLAKERLDFINALPAHQFQFDLFSNHSISQCVDLLHTLHEKNQIILKKIRKAERDAEDA